AAGTAERGPADDALRNEMGQRRTSRSKRDQPDALLAPLRLRGRAGFTSAWRPTRDGPDDVPTDGELGVQALVVAPEPEDAVVDEAVVDRAEREQVAFVVGAAVGEVVDVVEIEPERAFAAGDRAASAPSQVGRASDRRRDRAGPPPPML